MIKYLSRLIGSWFARWMRRNEKKFTCQLRNISHIVEEYSIEKIDLLKIDCEGAEYSALRGISDADWKKIRQVVVEVHDIDGRLEKVCSLLRKHGLDKLVLEKEKALEKTKLHNIFARR